MFWQRKAMEINKLVPTHNRLRSPDELWSIYQYFISGKSKPIVINTWNKQNYIHDGHHRMVLSYWMGNNFVEPSQYILSKYTNKEYREICFDKNWVTPFDLVNYVRVPDFGTFKDAALKKRSVGFIPDNYNLFRECREVNSLSRLADRYKPVAYIATKAVTEAEKALRLPEADLYGFVKLQNTNMTVGGACKADGNIVESRMSGWSINRPMEDARRIVE